jgi:hypothetical protein
LTSTPFIVGVLLGAVGAWFLERRRNGSGGGPGIGGARGSHRGGGTSHARYSGLGRFG